MRQTNIWAKLLAIARKRAIFEVFGFSGGDGRVPGRFCRGMGKFWCYACGFGGFLAVDLLMFSKNEPPRRKQRGIA